eukprot:TRINITY_DN1806_c0_g1_i6.p1 TRINITY_DN1806_c0_g1~~TRINITY_DN1806_c0_g1_i6.p1  ORF type:complete len:801 (-),score=129.85 TRINITY_DN1806_c0_g1_i6:943-3345(-)
MCSVYTEPGEYQTIKLDAQLQHCLNQMSILLETDRQYQPISQTPHSYSDKYALASHITNVSMLSQLHCLEILGLFNFTPLLEWAKRYCVTLEFSCEESCKFNREVVTEVPIPIESSSRRWMGLGSVVTTTKTVISKIIEFEWDYSVKYELYACSKDGKISITSGSFSRLITSQTSNNPSPKHGLTFPLVTDITWILQNINYSESSGVFGFSIDRASKYCHTPRRNPEIEKSLGVFHDVEVWAQSIFEFLKNSLSLPADNTPFDFKSFLEPPVFFVPVLPSFMNHTETLKATTKYLGFSLPPSDSEKIDLQPAMSALRFHTQALARKFSDIRLAFTEVEPQDSDVERKWMEAPDLCLLVALEHMTKISWQYSYSIDYIESVMKNQLRAAIGKEFTPSEFSGYVDMYVSKKFRKFASHRFAFPVKTPHHHSQGVLSITKPETSIDHQFIREILVTTKHVPSVEEPMVMSINSSTKISFTGDHYLHGHVSHIFDGNLSGEYNLNIRSNRFGCFVAVLGRVLPGNVFEPQSAIVLENKEDLVIPLLLESIPTPKQFKRAVSSLSPEQQRFANDIRSMQLSSTLFGICVVHVNPQLEIILNLPPNCLAKELQLVQDILELMIEYKISADMLSFYGIDSVTTSEKLGEVKENVWRMKQYISETKEDLLEAESQRRLKEILAGGNPIISCVVHHGNGKVSKAGFTNTEITKLTVPNSPSYAGKLFSVKYSEELNAYAVVKNDMAVSDLVFFWSLLEQLIGCGDLTDEKLEDLLLNWQVTSKINRSIFLSFLSFFSVVLYQKCSDIAF